MCYNVHMADKNIFKELARGKGDTLKTEPSDVAGSLQADGPASSADGQLTVDVYRDGDDIVIESAIAGIDPETDLDVHIKRDAVEIRGERKRSKTIDEKDYYYEECFWGTFSRTVILPEEIDPDAAKANFENGILTLRLPRLKAKHGKKVKVSAQ